MKPVKINNRIEYYDLAKGIGMICVIAGHMGMQYVNEFVYTFHMPLFFLISGYLLRIDRSASFVHKKARALLVPYLIAALVMMCINLLFPSLPLNLHNQVSGFLPVVGYWIKAILYGSGYYTNFFGIDLPFVGEIWFLLALFFGLLIVNFIGTRKNGWIIEGALAGAALWIARYGWLPFSLQSGAVAALFIHAGYVLSSVLKENGPRQKLILVISLLCWIVSLYLAFTTHLHMSLVRIELPHGLLDLLGGIGASVCILWVAQKCCGYSFPGKKAVLFFGRYSLIAMCVHYIDATILPTQHIYDTWMPSAIILKLLFILGFFILRLCWTACGMIIVLKLKEQFKKARHFA